MKVTARSTSVPKIARSRPTTTTIQAIATAEARTTGGASTAASPAGSLPTFSCRSLGNSHIAVVSEPKRVTDIAMLKIAIACSTTPLPAAPSNRASMATRAKPSAALAAAPTKVITLLRAAETNSGRPASEGGLTLIVLNSTPCTRALTGTSILRLHHVYRAWMLVAAESDLTTGCRRCCTPQQATTTAHQSPTRRTGSTSPSTYQPPNSGRYTARSAAPSPS